MAGLEGWQHFGLDGNISKIVKRLAMKFVTDIQGTQRMNPNYFGDPLTSLLTPLRHKRFQKNIFCMYCHEIWDRNPCSQLTNL